MEIQANNKITLKYQYPQLKNNTEWQPPNLGLWNVHWQVLFKKGTTETQTQRETH